MDKDNSDLDDISFKYGPNRNPKVPKFNCLVCEDSQCFDSTAVSYCRDAIKVVILVFICILYAILVFINNLFFKCWKSSKRDSSGVSFKRGCETSAERVQICVTSHPKSFSNSNAQFTMECCVGELCNNGSFPMLPSEQKGLFEYGSFFSRYC